ncbi:hypothetical protein GHT06_018387 [Daphnia sinensis]|uniref:Reverse transcriptase domain-containing protein n=1 Tax=Daphnia sinensis TaxID=1820382 RepID=A0AAD5PUQ5_9CRUS|nr:hypothetical protein GHT06_018387 [Daphnia sinensis]
MFKHVSILVFQYFSVVESTKVKLLSFSHFNLNGVDPLFISFSKDKKLIWQRLSVSQWARQIPTSSEPFQLRPSLVMGDSPSSLSSSESTIRRRALRSLPSGSMSGDTLTVDLGGNSVNTPDLPPDISVSRESHGAKKNKKKRRRSSDSSSSSISLSKKSRKDDGDTGGFDEPSNVAMLPRSRVRELRRWMKEGIESKTEGNTLRSASVPKFEGEFELMAPLLDPSMARKWLRNLGESSDRAKLKDFWEKQLLSLQREVKDVFQPLVYMLGIMPENSDAEMPVQTAIRLLGHVFSRITKMRRSNAMRHCAPKFSTMLIDNRLFSSRDYRYLFGNKFIDALEKEAIADAKMDQIGRYGGPSNNRGGSSHFRRGGSNSGSGANFNGQQYTGASNNNKYVSIFLPPVSSVDSSIVGGRLSLFTNAWQAFTDDPWILNILIPPEVIMDKEKTSICNLEVESLKKKGAIVIAPSTIENSFISNQFVVPKKATGKYRPIFNLKALNRFIRYEHFKMECLDNVKYLIRRNDWLINLDLQDAYFVVPVSSQHHRFLRFIWNGVVNQYLMKPIIAHLRKLGIRLLIYLDDMLILGSSHNEALGHLRTVVNLLVSLGFLINWEKSVVIPSQSIQFLGLEIDSRILSFPLPISRVKVENIVSLCRSVLQKDQVKLRELAFVLGNFSSSIPSVPYAQSNYRSLQRFYIQSVGNCSNLNKLWWVHNLNLSNGKSILPPCPDLSIYSDASLQGWGSVCDGITARGPWPLADQSRHINELELLGSLYALQIFTHNSSDISVSLLFDNSTAVAYVNNCGGIKSCSLSAISSQMISWCETRNISLSASHLPGMFNSIADRESRGIQTSPYVWPMEVDLFAAAWNKQLPKFVSWLPQTNAIAVNAFSFNWSQLNCYAFPPFAMIPRCLAKIMREKAFVILVCPLWPSQPWFPLLLEIAMNIPRVFSAHPFLIHSNSLEPHPLLQSKKFLLSAWRLSGDASKSEAFRQQLLHYCWPAPVDLHYLRISMPGTIGTYLTHLFDSSLATQTINLHRWMLSMTLEPINGVNIGEHPLVQHWNPDHVLNYLSSLPDNSDLSLSAISYKLVTLIALSSLLRVSEITDILRTSIHCSASAATFSLSRPRKTQHDGPLQSISLPRHSGRNCPVDCLENYLRRSKTLCPSSNSLFISLKKPYRPVGSSTIARWIKKCLSGAGIDNLFSAHSTRGSAASWTNESTFNRFYNRPLTSASVASSVLSQTD